MTEQQVPTSHEPDDPDAVGDFTDPPAGAPEVMVTDDEDGDGDTDE